MVWWQNQFPKLACITAPYARILIARSLKPESCFALRIAYFITRLSNLEDYLDHSEQLAWLSPESREEIINDLADLGMDELVQHLRKSAFAVIPHNAIRPVVESLSSRLDAYLNKHRAILIDDMESATGQTIKDLPKDLRLSSAASHVIEHLSLIYVMRFLRFIESADAELSFLKEQFLIPDIRVNLHAKRRFLDFRINFDRHLNSFDMQIPEIAEEWLFHVLELFEEYHNCFGK